MGHVEIAMSVGQLNGLLLIDVKLRNGDKDLGDINSLIIIEGIDTDKMS